jgi:hypothetical protein
MTLCECGFSLSFLQLLVEYREQWSDTDPRALLQQQIPQSFLDMDKRLKTKASELKGMPVMKYREFKSAFEDLFEGEDELTEAVRFLTLQGWHKHNNQYNIIIFPPLRYTLAL